MADQRQNAIEATQSADYLSPRFHLSPENSAPRAASAAGQTCLRQGFGRQATPDGKGGRK